MNWYKRSLRKFKKVVKKNKNITKDEWDKFAHENYYFSSMTLEAHADVYTFEDLKEKHLWWYYAKE